MARELILVVLVLAGCGKPEPRASQKVAGEPPEEARPAMQACAVDEDCTVVGAAGPSPDDPCCDAAMAGVAVSRAYMAWHYKHRQQHCRGVKCPPVAVPGSSTQACEQAPRCERGVCVSACRE